MTYSLNSPYPGDTSTTQIQWGRVEERQIETGLDRGVLYPKNGTAVAWNGLTSVEEEGGEGAAEYYVDGRPFLYLPKPREFKATVKAYTYPDAFSELVGEVEVADGMYLDSQVGDSFDLSYRTRIANPIYGENAGYKIHLIYNATVVPSPKAYTTIGNDINPVEFSWVIQAVPVRVVGYRPTAHITIDTRHMDSTRLSEIEELLYGSSTVDASMPPPQTIFDLLSFGNAIIITDNGDGTWSAEGSYHNIYMIGDELFQIDNVNGILHGDGTYTIWSTGENGGIGSTIQGSASFSGRLSLTANGRLIPSGITRGVASFTSQSSLTVNGKRKVRGSASFSAQSSMTANAGGNFATQSFANSFSSAFK